MQDSALKVLNILTSHGFKAYIVGGFVRDYILGIKGDDIDIATNATPREVMSLFEKTVLPKEQYGSVTLYFKNYRFEITTFRKEIRYLNNRKPVEIEYIDDLLEDLKRRDFKMNTLCMDKDGNIIDLLGGRCDIENKIINTVLDANFKFEQDSLRIMRAIRFATILNFDLNKDVKSAIIRHKSSLKKLSYERKKEELDKIFISQNFKRGISIIKELKLDTELDLYNLEKIGNCRDLLGIWSVIDLKNKYPFRKNEREIIKKIRCVIETKVDNYSLYKYGLYINQVACELLLLDKQEYTLKYEKLPIKTRRDIDITSLEIMNIIDVSAISLKEVYNDIERKIIALELENKNAKIKKYLQDKYK